MMPPIMGWFRTSPASGDYAEFLMPSGNILTVFYRLLPWRASACAAIAKEQE